MIWTSICGLVVGTSFWIAESRETEIWPQWRGPGRDAHSAGPSWPGQLAGEHLQPLWQVPLDRGYSGPIISDRAVFVTETEKKTNEVIRALDRNSGELLWRAEWPGSMTVPFFARSNGDWIRATPAFDGETLYVAGMRDILVALDASTGAERWRVDFVEKFGTSLPTFGFVCSPLVDGDDLYVQAGAAVCKLDKRTGDIRWRSLEDRGGMESSAFSSPVIAELAGRRQLVVQTRQLLAGVDLETGKVLWSQPVPNFRGMNILTPTISGNRIFTSAYKQRSFCYEIAANNSEDGFSVTEVWTNKLQGYMSSPVLIDGFLYLHLQNQRVACIEMETGAIRWITTERFGKYWSMVARGSRVLALDERGEMILFDASPERFIRLDTRRVSDSETWAHLAVVGDQIFVRGLDAIQVFAWK